MTTATLREPVAFRPPLLRANVDGYRVEMVTLSGIRETGDLRDDPWEAIEDSIAMRKQCRGWSSIRVAHYRNGACCDVLSVNRRGCHS